MTGGWILDIIEKWLNTDYSTFDKLTDCHDINTLL